MRKTFEAQREGGLRDEGAGPARRRDGADRLHPRRACATSPAPEAVSVVLGLLYSILAVRPHALVLGARAASAPAFWSRWRGRRSCRCRRCLQGYYVGMAVYGFWHWSRQDDGATRPVTHLAASRASDFLVAIIVALSVLTSRYLASRDAGGVAIPRLAHHLGQPAGHVAHRAGKAGKLAVLDRLRCDLGVPVREAGARCSWRS